MGGRVTVDVERLSNLARAAGLERRTALPVVTRPFFGGAALYVGGSIIASLSRVGLAFKIGEPAAAVLIADGEARPLRYFPRGHVKKGYVLFEEPDLTSADAWEPLFARALESRGDADGS